MVPERLRRLRDIAGISARELSRLAQLPSQSHVTLIESKGGTLSTTTATALARVFGCSLDWLVNGTGKEPSARAVRASVEEARRLFDAA